MSFKVPKHRSVRLSTRTPALYTPPSWAAPPSPGLSLMVIRSGVVLQELPLTTPNTFLVLGRASDVDIPAAHASLSRYHAIFQFGQSNMNSAPLCVYDLGSVHGTFVNKTRIKEKTLVPVYDGDFIKFGESTRDYVISARSSAENKPLDFTQRKHNREPVVAEKSVEERSAEADDHADNLWELNEIGLLVNNWDEYTVAASYGEDSLSASQRNQSERLEKKKSKVGNLMTERKRILEKEYTGFTQGQKHRLSVLEEQIATLSNQIKEVEMRIKAKQAVSTQHGSKEVSFSVSQRPEEELFHDRAEEKCKNKIKLDPVETESSLREKLRTHEKLLSEAKLLLSQKLSEWERLPQALNDDTLDSYIAQSKAALQREEAEKSRKEVEKHTKTVLRLKALVKMVSDRGSEVSPSTACERRKQETNPKEGLDHKLRETRMQTAILPELFFSADAMKSPRNSAAVKKTKDHKCETLDSLPQKRNDSRVHDVKRLRGGPKTLQTNPYSIFHQDDSEVWQPPADQTGDGRTSLNDELGY